MIPTYYIFRHGETFATKGNGFYGIHIITASILPEATPAITRMAKYLGQQGPSYNSNSPLRRCRQTARLITAETGRQFDSDWRLSEYFLEPLRYFKGRLSSYLRQMEREKRKNVWICTHGACIAGLTGLLLRGDFSRREIHEYPKPGVLLIFKNGKVTEIDFNKKVPEKIVI